MKIKDCTLFGTVSCGKSDSVLDVAQAFKDNKVRLIIVVDNKDFPIGVISPVDIVCKVVAVKLDSSKLKAMDIMSKPLLVADINDDLKKIYLSMVNKNIFSCPVIQDKKLKGVLSFNEALKHMVRLKKGN